MDEATIRWSIGPGTVRRATDRWSPRRHDHPGQLLDADTVGITGAQDFDHLKLAITTG
jgi:hypothetical protein